MNNGATEIREKGIRDLRLELKVVIRKYMNSRIPNYSTKYWTKKLNTGIPVNRG